MPLKKPNNPINKCEKLQFIMINEKYMFFEKKDSINFNDENILQQICEQYDCNSAEKKNNKCWWFKR